MGGAGRLKGSLGRHSFHPTAHIAPQRRQAAKVPAEIDAMRRAMRGGQVGWTPLMRAADGGHAEAADLLLAARADVGARLQVCVGGDEWWGQLP